MSAKSPPPDREGRRRQSARLLLQYGDHGPLSDEEAREAANIPDVITTDSGSTPVPWWCRCRDLRRMDLIRPVIVVRDGVEGYLVRRGASGHFRVVCGPTTRGRVFVKQLRKDIRAAWPARPDKPGDRIVSSMPRHEANPPGPPWDPDRK